MVRPLSTLINSKCVGAWMLKVPRTRPSRSTIRFAGGSSGAAMAGASSLVEEEVSAMALVPSGALAVAGVSAGVEFVMADGAPVGASAKDGDSGTGVGAGVGDGVGVAASGVVEATVGGTVPAGSCFKYWAATNA